MKKLNLQSTLFLSALLLFTACKKDKSGPTDIVKTTKEFVETLGPQQQLVKINASELPKTIKLQGGTQITFKPGSLTKNGIAVTGDVTIYALEMLKRSDILLGGANTNHVSGAPLHSDGFIFLDVKSGGVSVDKYLQVPIEIKIPAKREGATQLWEGVVDNNNQFAWQAPKLAGGGQRDVKAIDDNFAFDFGALGWINCDVFWSYSNPKTTVRVTVLNNPGSMAAFRAVSGETFVYFCAKGSNVVAQLYTPDGPNKVKSYDDMMPIGAEGKLISLCIKDGKFYFAKKDITITANLNETISLTETTQAVIQSEIDALNNY